MRPTVRTAALLAIILGAFALPAGAQGLGDSFGGLQVQGDQPIVIESDQLDVDDRSSVATFTGDVSVEQGDTRILAQRLVVHYTQGQGGAGGANMPGGGNDIERIEASGDVEITSRDQVASAQQADFDMATQIVVMTGDVVLSQGPNVAAGCRLTVHMDTGVARLQSSDCPGGASAGGTGRVRMLLTPGSENR